MLCDERLVVRHPSFVLYSPDSYLVRDEYIISKETVDTLRATSEVQFASALIVTNSHIPRSNISIL